MNEFQSHECFPNGSKASYINREKSHDKCKHKYGEEELGLWVCMCECHRETYEPGEDPFAKAPDPTTLVESPGSNPPAKMEILNVISSSSGGLLPHIPYPDETMLDEMEDENCSCGIQEINGIELEGVNPLCIHHGDQKVLVAALRIASVQLSMLIQD